MRNISQDIKEHKFKKVYLLYGEEGYLKKQYRDKLQAAICGDDTMNYAYFEGKGISVTELISMADTMPFFAEQRLIVVENSGFFKSANEQINTYVEQIPETAILVFVEDEVDKRSKLFKKIKEIGYVSEMGEQTPATLGKWIAGLLQGEGKMIQRDALDYFLATTGNDMNLMYSEIQKLISYALDKDTITLADVQEICVAQTVAKIFDMIDAMGNKNRGATLKYYYDMIEVKEPPMRILYMLVRQFNIMLQVKELKRSGKDAKEIAGRLALAPFVVNKAMRQVDKFRTKEIKNALARCVEVEEAVKNGRLEDKIAVEMILIGQTSIEKKEPPV